MVEAIKLVECGTELARAFALLDRANEMATASLPQLISKRGLLDEARRAVAAAQDALTH